MAYENLILTVYQHNNTQNAADPNNGYWACWQANAPNSVPQPIGAGRLAQFGATGAQLTPPYATLAIAQSVVALGLAYYAAQKAAQSVANSASPGQDAVVYGPVTT